MGMPLRISDELILRARLEAEDADRSITGQIEHWVKLGMALEDVLDHGQTKALRRKSAVSISEALAQTEGTHAKEVALAHLRRTEQPRYGVDANHPGRLVRIDPDGTRTVGRFVNRTFVPDDDTGAARHGRRKPEDHD